MTNDLLPAGPDIYHQRLNWVA